MSNRKRQSYWQGTVDRSRVDFRIRRSRHHERHRQGGNPRRKILARSVRCRPRCFRDRRVATEDSRPESKFRRQPTQRSPSTSFGEVALFHLEVTQLLIKNLLTPGSDLPGRLIDADAPKSELQAGIYGIYGLNGWYRCFTDLVGFRHKKEIVTAGHPQLPLWLKDRVDRTSLSVTTPIGKKVN